ncbi:MAG: hypothetical protein H6Q84_833 [Deltaproteobacteria bacterium]|nr:hypothetical protein [Deltaproteobacteria bacterium]
MEEPAPAKVPRRLHGPRYLPRDRHLRRDLVPHVADGWGGPGPAGPFRGEYRGVPTDGAALSGLRRHRARGNGDRPFQAHDGGQGAHRVDPPQGTDPRDRPVPADRRGRLGEEHGLDGNPFRRHGGCAPVVESRRIAGPETGRSGARRRGRGGPRQGRGGHGHDREKSVPGRRRPAPDGRKGGRDDHRRHRGCPGAVRQAGNRDVFRGGGALQGLPGGGHRRADRARPRWTSCGGWDTAFPRSCC